MKVGDLVRVRLKESPKRLHIGIVVRTRPRMYMVGNAVEVMINGVVRVVKEEHIEVINKKGVS